jgi:hypothetical protein
VSLRVDIFNRFGGKVCERNKLWNWKSQIYARPRVVL